MSVLPFFYVVFFITAVRGGPRRNNLSPELRVFNPKAAVRSVPFSKVLINNHVKDNHREDYHRQIDEDNEELPELAEPILKIIGSVLAGNASALIENSLGLLPSEVSDTVSSVLNVLVTSINSARPEASTEKSATSSGTPKASTVVTSTTEEDEEENEATTETILRSNSTSNDTESTTFLPLSTEFATLLSLLNTTERILANETKVATASANDTSDMAMLLLSLEAALDSDNKANWIPLVMPAAENMTRPMLAAMMQAQTVNQPMDDIDADNKANWASIFTNDLLSSDNATISKPIQRPGSIFTNTRENGKTPGTFLSQGAVTSYKRVTQIPLLSQHSGNTLKEKLTHLLSMNSPQVRNYSSSFANAIKNVESIQTLISTTTPASSYLENDILQLISSLVEGSGPVMGLLQPNKSIVSLAASDTKTGSSKLTDEEEPVTPSSGSITTSVTSSNQTGAAVTTSATSSVTSTTEDDDDDDDDEDSGESNEE